MISQSISTWNDIRFIFENKEYKNEFTSTSVDITAHCFNLLNKGLQRDSYNKKQQSIWIAEALKDMLDQPHDEFMLLLDTDTSNRHKGLEMKTIFLTLPVEIDKQLESKVGYINETEVGLTGVKRRVIYTAIYRRYWKMNAFGKEFPLDDA
ncbi:hypothetical protein [Spartinivicinus poritis]|uniref:Uncharacterized protein n=1 Tax=Spartinivicinus poritis TaxID=2994640 RepID=A0ABT5ULT1_9GAMM|nr:hypothetical protein [Spartinivicinus sp. A2-2]MDE1465974.1 hypothetical protein [Spartinivicinus sp. A2-2]